MLQITLHIIVIIKIIYIYIYITTALEVPARKDSLKSADYPPSAKERFNSLARARARDYKL